MPAMTPANEAAAACRGVLSAALAALDQGGACVPERAYVSIQGGDWSPGNCEDCCSQLVVVPMTAVTRMNNPLADTGFGDPSSLSIARTVEFQIIESQSVNVNVDANKLVEGDPTLPWDAAENAGSHWQESMSILTSRWALARRLSSLAVSHLCAEGLRCRDATVTAIEPFVEGGCAGSRVTLAVQL